MHTQKDCIFCKIVSGEIPSYKVYEDEKVIAFLDINPVNIGHTLLVPKEHYALIEELPEDLAKYLIIMTQKMIHIIKKEVNSRGVNLTLNNGKVAGQEIPHVHFHIMPRFETDNYSLWQGHPLPKEEMQKIAEKIRNAL